MASQDIQAGWQMLATLIEALDKAGVETSQPISTATEEVDLFGMNGDRLQEERSGVEAAVSAALDLLDANRSRSTRPSRWRRPCWNNSDGTSFTI